MDIVKKIFTLAIPILFANLLQSAYQLIDAFWVGRLGEDAVAAVSLSFPITFFLISVGGGFSIAGATLIAQYFGAKNKKMVNHIAAQTILLVVIVSIILSMIGYFSSSFILQLIGVEQQIFPEALSFLKISFLGLVFVFGFFMFQSILRGIGEVKMPMKIVFFTVILNLIFDPLFIFGFGIIPAMGVSGAALATLCTQATASILGIYFLFKGNYGIKISFKSFKPDFSYIKKAFFLGFPSSIEMSLRSLGLVLMTFLITSFGTTAIASYGAGSNVIQMIMILAMGLSMAVSALVGQNIGAKNMKLAQEIANTSLKISFIFLTIMGIVVFIFAKSFIGFFVPGEESVINLGARFLKFVALSFGFIGVQMAITGVLRASGNMKTALILTLISQWLIQFPLAYILSKHTSLGIDGLWIAILLTNILISIIALLVFISGNWKNSNLTEDYKMQEKVFEDTAIERGYKH